MNTHRGFILFTSISLLAIMSVFLLSLMQAVFLFKEVIQLLHVKHQYDHQLEAAVKDLSHKSATWILTCKASCAYTYKDQNFQLKVKDLGVYPCLQWRENNTLFATHHWDIILSNEVTKQSIQVRLAKPDGISTCLEPSLLKSPLLSVDPSRHKGANF